MRRNSFQQYLEQKSPVESIVLRYVHVWLVEPGCYLFFVGIYLKIPYSNVSYFKQRLLSN